MPDAPGTTLSDYERGFRDGVVAASTRIAEFYNAIKTRDRKALASMQSAQEVFHGVLLKELAPLQDEVRGLQP